jgi:hypothetical protein
MKKKIFLTETELINLIEKMVKGSVTNKLTEDMSIKNDVLDFLMTSVDPNSYDTLKDYYDECLSVALSEYEYNDEEVIRKFANKNWLNRE